MEFENDVTGTEADTVAPVGLLDDNGYPAELVLVVVELVSGVVEVVDVYELRGADNDREGRESIGHSNGLALLQVASRAGDSSWGAEISVVGSYHPTGEICLRSS